MKKKQRIVLSMSRAEAALVIMGLCEAVSTLGSCAAGLDRTKKNRQSLVAEADRARILMNRLADKLL